MRAQVTWIGIVVGLLLMSVVTQGVLIVLATTDPSFAVEPDYDAKAARWDDHQRQERENARLGWTVDLGTKAASVPGAVDVTLTAFGTYGKPLRDATVDVEAFHNARASEVLRARLEPAGDGVYAARLPMRRSGVWEFRLTITRGGDIYTETVRSGVLVPPRVPSP
jgi:nitrogen fixation protein FixH